MVFNDTRLFELQFYNILFLKLSFDKDWDMNNKNEN